MFHSKRAITLVELLVAAVLFVILMLGVVSVVKLITRTSRDLRFDLSKNEEMVYSTYHFNRNVKDSGYLIIRDDEDNIVEEGGVVLELYSTNDGFLGRYELSGTTLSFTNALNEVSVLGENIALTFAEARHMQDRTITASIRFTEPFQNTVYITCRRFIALKTVRLTDPAGVEKDIYENIQDAINAADDRDIVQIGAKPGGEPYFENIVIEDKSVDIRGGYDILDWDAGQHYNDPNFQTIIDGQSLGSVITINFTAGGAVGLTSTIDGVTIRNGRDDKGGGISANAHANNSYIVISNNTITENEATSEGGGIYASATNSSTIDILNNIITGNEATENGGGIFADTDGVGSSINILNNTITGNQALQDGGGVCASAGNSSFIDISNNTITGNEATGSGGGIFADTDGVGSSINISNNTITGNESDIGGGIYASATNSSTIDILSNIITGNSARQGGGIDAIASNASAIEITDNVITGNTADSRGGGIYANASDSSSIIISNNTITENIVGAEGVIIYYYSGQGGGIWAGAITNSSVSILNNIITGNEAGEGGGVFVGVSGLGSSSTVSNNILAENSADRGGGIWSFADNQATINIINNTIVDNLAEVAGGVYAAIDVDSLIAVLNIIAYGNGVNNICKVGAVVFNYSNLENYDDPAFLPGAPSEPEKNFEIAPLFVDSGDGDYRLANGSPCIDMGNPAVQYNDPVNPSSPGNALLPAKGTIRNDLGVYGGQGADITIGAS